MLTHTTLVIFSHLKPRFTHPRHSLLIPLSLIHSPPFPLILIILIYPLSFLLTTLLCPLIPFHFLKTPILI